MSTLPGITAILTLANVPIANKFLQMLASPTKPNIDPIHGKPSKNELLSLTEVA